MSSTSILVSGGGEPDGTGDDAADDPASFQRAAQQRKYEVHVCVKEPRAGLSRAAYTPDDAHSGGKLQRLGHIHASSAGVCQLAHLATQVRGVTGNVQHVHSIRPVVDEENPDPSKGPAMAEGADAHRLSLDPRRQHSAGDSKSADSPVIGASPTTIGRADSNAIVLTPRDVSVSRKHAQVHFEFNHEGFGGVVCPTALAYVTDVGSTAGSCFFVRDDRGVVYRKSLDPGRDYRLDVLPDLKERQRLPPELLVPEHIGIYDRKHNQVTTTKVWSRLTVIGVSLGTVNVALQPTGQKQAWKFVSQNFSPSTPVYRSHLPCVDAYLDYLLKTNKYVPMGSAQEVTAVKEGHLAAWSAAGADST